MKNIVGNRVAHQRGRRRKGFSNDFGMYFFCFAEHNLTHLVFMQQIKKVLDRPVDIAGWCCGIFIIKINR
nr:hypothetical protein [Sodalis ligni]